MKPNRISAADPVAGAVACSRASRCRVVIVTLDRHLADAAVRAGRRLAADAPGMTVELHAAVDWARDPSALDKARAAVAEADVLIVTMLFIDEHIRPILPALRARRDQADAVFAAMSAGEIVRLTKLDRFDMSAKASGVMGLLKRLRGGKGGKDGGPAKPSADSGARQLKMVKRLPKILRLIPGTAQDVRAYFLMLQYWLSASEHNIEQLVRFAANRYAKGPRAGLRGGLPAKPPREYPEIGVYHPDLPDGLAADAAALPASVRPDPARPRVGLILLQSYLLSGDAGHYDGVIRAMEARGLEVVPVYAQGLDSRPAIERFLMRDGRAGVDALVSLTGFSLVGGPAYNDSDAAAEILGRLDIPYVSAQALEFQTLSEWRDAARGLTPIEATLMVAIPEIDGATGPIVFGGRGAPEPDGRADPDAEPGSLRMGADPERADRLAARVAKLVALRRTPKAERRIAVTLFNFPPNAGAAGTAAFLDVFASLRHTLQALRAEGYSVGDLPETAEALRRAITVDPADPLGGEGRVHARIAVDDHVRAEPHLAEIEAQWGPAPGRAQTDGRALLVLGARFGNVFVGLQPAFGYEGDPMRLLFEKGFAPTHAFSAYYRWLREDFAAHACLHFGTHGALEFMPGAQVGLTAACWPDRMIGDLPHFYLYAANNPSEGAIAKRRSAATLISYLTPPLAEAGLYRGLAELKASLDRWRSADPEAVAERTRLAEMIQAQAAVVDLAEAEPVWSGEEAERAIAGLGAKILEVEYALIPDGLHVVGAPPSEAARADMLRAMSETDGVPIAPATAASLAAGAPVDDALLADALLVGAERRAPEEDAARGDAAEEAALRARLERLAAAATHLAEDPETPALLRALDGRFTTPSPSGDLLRTSDILPTGRNIHGFDPFRMPSAFAMADGAAQADRLLARHRGDHLGGDHLGGDHLGGDHLGGDQLGGDQLGGDQLGGDWPRTVAIVLWGSDNLKSEGAAIAQTMALLGARPRLDAYGRVCGAELIPLAELGRPRIDVLATLSGIFRDLLPLQTKMLAEAAYLAATAEDEPLDQNFVRAHALAHQARHGGDLETAALRVFSNADGAYGSNVNQLIDSGAWDDEDELADAYQARKCFAYGRAGAPQAQPEILKSALSTVDLAYQNLESVELGVTTIDHYFDTLGGVGRAVRRAKGAEAPVYIGDQTRGEGKVRSLSEQVALETRSRTLNPKWYEAMLRHGYEGVRQIEAHVTNTVGWSATTGQVDPWVYARISETFVLDDDMRQRLAALNPKASARVANRLIEASERDYWTPDDETLEALRRAGEELEDALEGAPPAGPVVPERVAAA